MLKGVKIMANKKSKFLVMLALPCIVIVAVIAYSLLKSAQPEPPSLIIDTQNQPTLGDPNASAHIVAFEDLKCVNCAMFNNTIFPKIKETYIDTGKARYTMFNLAFIPGSLAAANAAHCLYDQKPAYFFTFVDYIYRNQPPEDENWATTPRLLQFAKAATPDANLNRLSNCIIEGKYNDLMAKNLQYAMKLMDDHVATPTVYINGRELNSFDMKTIDRLLKLPPKQEK